MSLEATIFYCTKCDYEELYTYSGKNYIYKTANGDKISAPRDIGWCLKCNGVRDLNLGLSIESLKESIDNVNFYIKRIRNSKRFLIPLSKFEEQELESANRIADTNKDY